MLVSRERIASPNNNPAKPTTAMTKQRPGGKQAKQAKALQAQALSLAAFRALDPFPPMIRRSFRYADLHQMTTAATTGYFGSENRYNMNSLYDPYYTGAGHQPYGFDQIMASYTKYRVERVTFRITFTTPGGAADILCAASYGAGTSASLAGVAPAPICEWPNAVHGHLSSSGTRVCYLTGTINLWEVCNVTKQRYETDDIYVGSVSANPSQVALLSFAIASYSAASSEAASVLVELEYDAIVYDRQVIAAS